MYAITAENISKSFGRIKALNNVSVKVESGTIFGLIGPDGAGKTTLLRILAGLMHSDSGKAHIFDFDCETQQTEIKDNIAYMSQKFGLYQDLTVYENIKTYAELYGVSKEKLEERIDELLDFSYMRPFKKRRAGQLSGGMKQKLQLICALIHKPKVLLLDEPTNGVDPVSRRDFWRILYNLSSEGVTILVTTAYLDEAERCTRIALLNKGCIQSEGTPQEVVRNSGLKIHAVKNDKNIQLDKLLTDALPDADIHRFGEHLRIATTDNHIDEKLKNILPPHINAKIEHPKLEDIFMYLDSSETDTAELLSIISSGANKRSGSSVSIDKLTKKFGDFTAVNSVNLDVKYGEIYGFLGPNGAGKSTTIKMLCGLLLPTSGSGSVAGLDIFSTPEQIKANIGYMSQKFSLYEDLKVYENIDFYGGIYGLNGKKLKERRAWALKLAGLEDRKNDMTSNLTGGWRQRLALACAILHSPPIVFLDEPTSGADPASRRLFWDIISALADSGVTVFVSTHYMEEAEYCDRLSMIFRGNMIAEGTPMSLKTDYMKEKIINIQVAQPQKYINSISTIQHAGNAALFGAGIHIRTDKTEEVTAAVADLLKTENAEFKIEVALPSMEDVFVSLIDNAEVDNG